MVKSGTCMSASRGSATTLYVCLQCACIRFKKQELDKDRIAFLFGLLCCFEYELDLLFELTYRLLWLLCCSTVRLKERKSESFLTHKSQHPPWISFHLLLHSCWSGSTQQCHFIKAMFKQKLPNCNLRFFSFFTMLHVLQHFATLNNKPEYKLWTLVWISD